jgi:pimeloyl-ACP methyl ester carboxylesterase
MQTVYFISGLGANRRTFSRLDLQFCQPVFLDWLQPEKGETLESYAVRLMQAIPEEAPIIVGLSMGGMMATEIAKRKPAARVIIISSNKTRTEFPAYLRIGVYLPFHRWIPAKSQQDTKRLFRWIIGPKGDTSINLLRSIQRESDPHLTNTFIDMILRWKNETVPPNVVHIHGTADRLLWYRKVKADYTIKGGTHLMVMNNAAEISELLKKLVTGKVLKPKESLPEAS